MPKRNVATRSGIWRQFRESCKKKANIKQSIIDIKAYTTGKDRKYPINIPLTIAMAYGTRGINLIRSLNVSFLISAHVLKQHKSKAI